MNTDIGLSIIPTHFRKLPFLTNLSG